MDHILVTGGAGFIGSHLVEELLRYGYQVTVLDNFSSGKMENLEAVLAHPQLRVLRGDVREPLWPQLVGVEKKKGSIQAVVHLAAQLSVVKSVEDPVFDAEQNLIGSLRVLELLDSDKEMKLLFASSAAVYGSHAYPSIEDGSIFPLSPYGIHKYAVELHLKNAARSGKRCLSFRFFNVYGERQDPSSPYAGVISIFMKRARMKESLSIYGDGGALRDFIYVGDLVKGIREGLENGPFSGESVNLGRGQCCSILELATLINRLYGSHEPLSFLPEREGDIRASLASRDKGRALFDWEPKVALEEGLRAMMEQGES